MSAEAPVPAAQYVRMSTDDQQYSIENQQSAIKEYADRHGFAIVETFTDAGKSGVTIDIRKGLRRLLQEVVGGRVQYRAILVYDISRWGRFQDADEAAHYEFICKRAGAPVHYCAEPFENDGTMSSALLKSLKRMMAAEYSRELGVKVHAGKKRLAQMGFRMGGTPGLGYKRKVFSEDGRREVVLKDRQEKFLKTDHVVLVLGPREEVACVRKIFKMAVEGTQFAKIADHLNKEGVATVSGRPWNYNSVYKLVTNRCVNSSV
jgi:DNA invertase Pin-like site-specific DNA recombinase